MERRWQIKESDLALVDSLKRNLNISSLVGRMLVHRGIESPTQAPKFLNPTLDHQMARGNVFAGTPDQVYEQIKAFWEYAGGFGHMLIMGQAGFLSDEDAVKSMKLYSNEVYPRLRELTKNADPAELWEKSKAMDAKDGVDLGTFGVEFVR